MHDIFCFIENCRLVSLFLQRFRFPGGVFALSPLLFQRNVRLTLASMTSLETSSWTLSINGSKWCPLLMTTISTVLITPPWTTM